LRAALSIKHRSTHAAAVGFLSRIDVSWTNYCCRWWRGSSDWSSVVVRLPAALRHSFCSFVYLRPRHVRSAHSASPSAAASMSH